MLGMRGEPPELEYKAEFSALVAMITTWVLRGKLKNTLH